jgi:hypothetical protein
MLPRRRLPGLVPDVRLGRRPGGPTRGSDRISRPGGRGPHSGRPGGAASTSLGAPDRSCAAWSSRGTSICLTWALGQASVAALATADRVRSVGGVNCFSPLIAAH